MTSSNIERWIEEQVFVENSVVNVRNLSSYFHIKYAEAENHLEDFFKSKKLADVGAIFYVSGYTKTDSTKAIKEKNILKISIIHDFDVERVKSSMDEVLSVRIYGLKKNDVKHVSDIYCFGSRENSVKKAKNEHEILPRNVATELREKKLSENTKCKEDLARKKTTPQQLEKPRQNVAAKLSDRNFFDESISKKDFVGKKVKSQKSEKSRQNVATTKLSDKKLFDDSESDDDFISKKLTPKKSEKLRQNVATKLRDKKSFDESKIEGDLDEIVTSPSSLHSDEIADVIPSSGAMTSQLSDGMDDVVPPTPAQLPRSDKMGVAKRQKMVHKTYLDDEGYLVTVKESQTELINLNGEKCVEPVREKDGKIEKINARANDVNTKIKSTNQPNPKKPKIGAEKETQGKKQASLMSFFKK